MDEEEKRSCPACSSDNIEKIPDDEKIYGVGLYDIYDFIGGIDKITVNYRCLECGYEWM